jgi:hypothetical protein
MFIETCKTHWLFQIINILWRKRKLYSWILWIGVVYNVTCTFLGSLIMIVAICLLVWYLCLKIKILKYVLHTTQNYNMEKGKSSWIEVYNFQ